MKERIRSCLKSTGALAVGFAEAGKIDFEAERQYAAWIGEGLHGEMEYLERHLSLKTHTDNVLRGARTVISLAYGYVPAESIDEGTPYISSYAYGKDYHLALRNILKPVVEELRKDYGGEWRICIDSAPVAERYWAIKAGIGKRGFNGSVIVEGGGPMCFLAEILTTVKIPADRASTEECVRCMECLRVCPTKALRGDGTIDSRKCINYLTIEKKSDLTPEEEDLITEGKGYLFGCDLCQKVCPHRVDVDFQNTLPCFRVRKEIREIRPDNIVNMTSEEFKKIFYFSPMAYAGYKKLKSNSIQILSRKK